jgi:hypothetical protein
VLRISLFLVGLALAASACQASPGEQSAADTDISVQTTDFESLPVGRQTQCIERLTKAVDTDYVREHDVEVTDETSAAFAIENAIVDVCGQVDPDSGVHEAAHEVVHEVEERLR